MNMQEILNSLKQQGFRTTVLRLAILDILFAKNEPVSVKDLISNLNLKKLNPNESTVYRQIQTLVDGRIVDAITIDANQQFFEIKKEHHHHFVCGSCNDIQDFHSKKIESAFHSFEKELERKGLKVNKHELTFFGQCLSCN